jgi:hypothetical protein
MCYLRRGDGLWEVVGGVDEKRRPTRDFVDQATEPEKKEEAVRKRELRREWVSMPELGVGDGKKRFAQGTMNRGAIRAMDRSRAFFGRLGCGFGCLMEKEEGEWRMENDEKRSRVVHTYTAVQTAAAAAAAAVQPGRWMWMAWTGWDGWPVLVSCHWSVGLEKSWPSVRFCGVGCSHWSVFA